MPTMAAITVKKNDGTTDIVYTNVVASGGDKSPAIWRSQTVGTAAGQRPEARFESRSNGDQTGRRLDFQYSYPSLATGSDGKINVTNRFNLTVSAIVPLGMLDADLNEAVSQSMNMLATQLIKDSFKTGFAPT
jgi:hypothetical protein